MPEMPDATGGPGLQEIARFLTNAGYTEEGLKKLGLSGAAWPGSPERERLLWNSAGSSVLRLLGRLFFVCEPVEDAAWRERMPAPAAQEMLRAGMLHRESQRIIPDCMLVPWSGLLLACDSVLRAAESAADLVLGVNPTTNLLANCAAHRPGQSVLDLGTGCGPLALASARAAASVLGTDINARSLEFARFNAALNGIENAEFRAGDRFEPAGGRKFDLILSNPPFFLSPDPRLLYCDNPMELDGFVECLARTASAYLNESGYFQMLAEWVQFAGRPWEQRLREWFANSGCDVLILRAYRIEPADYTLKRRKESDSLYRGQPAESFQERMEYYRRREVEAMFGGLISLRRRAGKNWFRVEEMADAPGSPIGELLRERFATLTAIECWDDQRILAAKPELPPDSRLVSESERGSRAWEPRLIYLERRCGLPAKLGFDGTIADLVARFDGSATLLSCLERLAAKSGAPRDRVLAEGLRLVKRLGSAGLVRFAGEAPASG